MEYRKALKIVTGSPATDGAGVKLVRVIGSADVRDFDPFLMLDAFDSENPDDYTAGFPWHPHRGIETVTFLIRGEIEHGDSLGNRGRILDGGCQWMTAGSGIIHEEMPKASPRMLGLQLWLNLPAKDKMAEPKYRDLVDAEIPALIGEGSRIRVVSGSCGGVNGAMRADYVDATMLDISLDAGARTTFPVPRGHSAFFYILEGSASIDPYGGGPFLEPRRAVLLGEGDALSLRAPASEGLRCVFFSGPPLREPIAWGGPIVMNTKTQLSQAFDELDAGTFIKRKA